MSTGIKRTFFPIRMFFPVLIPILVLALIYGSSFFHGTNEAQANVATFHPGHCLGGWKNVDNIAGTPDVRPNNDTVYDDSNSASLFNANAQVFCGGFDGEIPATAKHERVTLNFSWYIGDGPQPERTESGDRAESAPVTVIEESSPAVEEMVSEPETLDEENPTASEEAAPAVAPEKKVEEVAPAPIESAKPTAFRFLRDFVSVAHAQEVPPEETVPEPVVGGEAAEEIEPKPEAEAEEQVVSEVVSSTTLTTQNTDETVAASDIVAASLTPQRSEEEQQAIEEAHEQAVIDAGKPVDAYFEVLYTLDGEDWHTLGYVNRIANDVQIELPIDLFATVEDLKKVQIALHTVERFDTVPKIYLDSLWLEVSYDDVTAIDLAPPGQMPGDIIFSRTSYEDSTAVVVLRNVELMTLSNVLAAASSTASSSPPGQATTTSSIATSTASSTEQDQVITNLMSTSTLSDIINTTGVQVELWLYSSTTNEWSRIADDSIISRNPQVKFVDGNIFWVDKSDASIWRYNPKSGGYDALSFSEGQSKMLFRNESGELRELDFSYGTSSVQLNAVSNSLVE